MPGCLIFDLLVQIPDTVPVVVLPSECNLVHFTKVFLSALKAIFIELISQAHLLCSGL